MWQPVDCLAPYSMEAFLDRRMEPLPKPFMHLAQPRQQPRRSRSSPGHVASKSKASSLKLELIHQPVYMQCEDYDAEDTSAGEPFGVLPWTGTDEDNCGAHEEEVHSAQLPVVLWTNTDDENEVAYLEEEEDVELAEPSTLWPDTDSEGSEFDAPSSTRQWLIWQNQLAHASAPKGTTPCLPDAPKQQIAMTDLANAPISPCLPISPLQQAEVADLANPISPSPAMLPMQQTAVSDLANAPINPSPPMPCYQRLPLPCLLTSRRRPVAGAASIGPPFHIGR